MGNYIVIKKNELDLYLLIQRYVNDILFRGKNTSCKLMCITQSHYVKSIKTDHMHVFTFGIFI